MRPLIGTLVRSISGTRGRFVATLVNPDREGILPRVDKVRDWFGTPAAAAKTLIWLCWVSLLVSVLVTVLYLAVLGVVAVAT